MTILKGKMDKMDMLKTKTCALLAGGMLAFAAQNALAQTTPTANTFDCSGSILHGRTQPIAQAILAALPTGTECAQVTLNQLSSITQLSLTNHIMTSLRTNDFAGMSGLQSLYIEGNQLTNLPSGVFDNLDSLRTLSLYRNRLSSLPTGIFDNLPRLQRLVFSGNQITNLPPDIFDELTDLRSLVLDRTPLTSLPSGIFDELTNLQLLFLERNQLTDLPNRIFDKLTKLQMMELHDTLIDSLPANIFDKLINMEHLDIKSNRLTSLPEGIFDRLTKLHTLELQNNRLTSLPGDIFDELTRLKTLYLADNQLTSLPDGIFDNLNLETLTLSGNSFPPMPCTDSDSPLYGRTQKVVDALLGALGTLECDQVTTNQLASIDRLELDEESLTSLQTNDFAGLANLKILDLHDNQLTNLPSGVFDGLSNLQSLYLHNNQLTNLPSGVFDDLASLQNLYLYNNQLANLPDGIFDNLVNLRWLYLYENQISSLPSDAFDNLGNLLRLFLYDNRLSDLPSGVFDNLPNVIGLFLNDNQLTNLPSGIFDGLTGMRRLHMENNRLASFPEGVFDELANLRRLTLGNNRLASLRSGVFDNLVNLDTLDLSRNPLSAFPAAVFDRLTNLERLWFAENRFASLPANLFDQLTNLEVLGLGGNQLIALPDGVFDELTNLERLRLENNQLRSLTAGVFDELASLETLDLSNNQLASLPDGVFDRLTNLVSEAELTGNPLSVVISLSPTALEVTEGDAGLANANFQVRLSQSSATTAVTVRYATRDGTAIAGEDYRPIGGTLTFAVDTTDLVQTLSIPIIGDTRDEPDETFTITLSNPTNAIFAGNANTVAASVTILDNDVPDAPPTPSLPPAALGLPSLFFSASHLNLDEGESATYQVRGTALLPADMIVRLRTSHPQLMVEPSTLVFAPTNWLDFQTVTVTAGNDAADHGEQAFIGHSIDAGEFFLADEDAGIVSITLAHAVAEEPNGGKDIIEPEPVDPEPEPPSNGELVDYDADDDGLIEISNLAQLNAIRWDLDGDGQPDKPEFADAYSLAFPGAIANMGMPADILAKGYELTSSLSFDTNEDGAVDQQDAFWNEGAGWPSIGRFAKPFQAVLDGNGHKIVGLFQDRSDAVRFAGKPSGLFGALGNRAQISHLALEEVSVHGLNWVGSIAGLSQGQIVDCEVSGRIFGGYSVGGLVGHNFGLIARSFVQAEVTGLAGAGALAGWNSGRIEGSSAQGQRAENAVGFGTAAR